jgi:hypothetical protein
MNVSTSDKEWLRLCGIMGGRSVPCEVLEDRMKLYGDALACRESRVVKSTSANGRVLLSVNRRARSEGTAGHIFVWHTRALRPREMAALAYTDEDRGVPCEVLERVGGHDWLGWSTAALLTAHIHKELISPTN